MTNLFEIHPCRVSSTVAGIENVERCELLEADFFTLYRRLEDGTVDAIQDFPIINDLVIVAGDISIINIPPTTPRQERNGQ